MSYDRSVCNVYYTCEPDRYPAVEAAFEGAKGAIRSLMAKKLSWRVAPELRFMRDGSVDAAETVGKYIAQEKARQTIAEETIGEGEEF